MSLQKLWNLQKIRIMYEEVKEEYKNSPLLAEIKSLKAEIENADEEIKKLNQQVKETGKKARKCYQEEMEMEEKEGKLKERLYGGNILNPKELGRLQEKLAKLAEDKSRSADEYLELSILQEDLQEKINKLQEEVEDKKMQYAAALANFQSYKEECQEKLNQLAEKHKALKAEIDSKLIEKYKKMFERFGNTVIARMEGNRCSGCHMELSISLQDQVRKGESLVKCENCDRILYKGE
ncbi:MAG: uncharacterized protein PWQ96_1321 [Clostridia bacterium]|nr:hypothetical protein [Clostridiales bacterium]MDK2985679.1 uncharacterized protein [Clostridia bacterium]